MFTIYKVEKEAGLAEQIKASRRVALASAVSLVEPFSLSSEILRAVKAHCSRATNLDQAELAYLNSVLVTAGLALNEAGLPAGLNLNDDYFDIEEVWAARHTPEDKPVNFEHDFADIVGHITANSVLGVDGKPVPDDTPADDLPERFQVITGSVLYKHWEGDETRQERMDRVLAELAQQLWFVSMECHFQAFDYLRVSAKGASIIQRNRSTAFLTKHLRAYGGDGTYQGDRIGRVLRNISFSGMGLVKRPANPESVVLHSTSSEAPRDAALMDSPPEAKPVYQSISKISATQNESKNDMSVELEKQLAEAKNEIERLQAQLRENDVKAITAAKEKAEAALLETKKQLDAQLEMSKASTESIAQFEAKLSEAIKARDAIQAELTKFLAERTKAARIAQVQNDLKLEVADATAFVEAHLAETDELFTKTLASLVKALTLASKTSPAQVLDTAKPVVEAALAVDSTSKSDTVRKQILSFLCGAEAA